IAGCTHFGTHFHGGRFYCIDHWREEVGEQPKEECTDCNECTVSFKCCVKDCNGEGIITQIGTQNHYCVKHAWKVDRPDEAGLYHPTTAHWNAEDTLRAHGAGAAIDTEKLPAVPESVAEQCKRELEEGKKKGWKIR